MSKRKAFNFYFSYYDIAKELTDKDRLAFYDAIIKRQFFGIETELSGLAKLAYISQKHSVDAQVSGWESKMKEPLNQSNFNFFCFLKSMEWDCKVMGIIA